MKPDEQYHNEAGRDNPPVTAKEPHEMLHIRVTTLEGNNNQQQQQLENIHEAMATLQDQMDTMYSELGLS